MPTDKNAGSESGVSALLDNSIPVSFQRRAYVQTVSAGGSGSCHNNDIQIVEFRDGVAKKLSYLALDAVSDDRPSRDAP
jgi:hypothetical protein